MKTISPHYIQSRSDNDTKVTDSTPSLTWEQVKSTTLTANTNEIIRVDRIHADLAANVTNGGVGSDPAAHARIYIGYSLENDGDSAKTEPDVTLGTRNYLFPLEGGADRTDCTDNNFQIKRTGISEVGEVGKDIIVRFWMKYELVTLTPVVQDYCTRNCRVTIHTNQRVNNE